MCAQKSACVISTCVNWTNPLYLLQIYQGLVKDDSRGPVVQS